MKTLNALNRRFCSRVAVLALTLSTAWGGSFSSDFNSGLPAGSRVFGNAVVSNSGGADNSGVLRLTSSIRNQQGSWVIEDLDNGKPVAGFLARFKVRIGGGTGAEGFSFNFAPDLPNAPFGVEGAGLGLSISFDSFNNSAEDAPGIVVRFRGVKIASKRLSPRTGDGFQDVVIRVKEGGALDLTFGSTTVFTNLFAYSPVFGRFGLGARTGIFTDDHVVDDFSVTTTLAVSPYVKSFAPSGLQVQADLPLTVVLKDFNGTVDPASIRLEFNDRAVTPTVSKNADETTVGFQPPSLLPSRSINSVKLIYGTVASSPQIPGSPQSVTARFDFSVSPYAVIPARYAIATNLMDLGKPGFQVRTVQARQSPTLPPTVARAEAQLTGTLIDLTTGQPYVNEALPGPNSDKTFAEAVLNFEQDGNPAGFFATNDKPFPGVPTTASHTDNIAMEAIAYLHLAAGFHRFGVNSDEGFRVTVSDQDPRDAFSLVLGQFDGGRSVGETQFSFLAETNGFYAFRLVWFESDGFASLEFFSVLDDGTRVLINSPGVPEAIPAYGSLKAGSPALPYVQSVDPLPGATRVTLKPDLLISLMDGQSRVATNTIQLKLDGSGVIPIIGKANGRTQIAYTVPQGFTNATLHSLSLAYSDDATPPNLARRDWTFTTEPEYRPTGQWDFDRGDLRATMGSALAFGDGLTNGTAAFTTFGSTASFGIPNINGELAAIMKYTGNGGSGVLQQGYTFRHGIPANGGGTKVNQWTVLMDIFFQNPPEGPLCSLLQLDDVKTDGDLFARWNNIAGRGTGGVGTPGRYDGDGRTSVHLGQWHRLAVSVDVSLDAPLLSVFVDGVKFQDQYLTPPQLDGPYSLGPIIRLFADDSNELTSFYLNSIQFLDGKLTDAQIASLGGPQANGIPNKYVVAAPPAIAPFITAQPTNRTVNAGLTTLFSVTAVGTEPLSYQWMLNGSEILGATNATLTVKNVQPPNAGRYTVEISNAGGVVVSAAAVLTVLAPVVIEKQPESQAVLPGARVTLEVIATGSPAPTFQWRFNNANISGATNSTLVLTDVQSANFGNYTVIASNSLGSVTSATATLKLFIPLTITQQPQPKTVLAGANVSLTVAASGNEPFGYQWRFNSKDLPGATNALLLLTNVQPTQSGNYSALVSDATSSVLSADALLTVTSLASTEPPKINGWEIRGDSYQFSVTVAANTKLAVEYSDSLEVGSWMNLTNFTATAVSSNVIVTDSISLNSQRFYRLKVVP